MKKLLVRGVLFLLGAVVLLVASGLVWRAVRQHRVAGAMAIPAAPRKSMLLIPGASHMALMTQPDSFLKFLLANVRPLALQP
jgi:hypothetical protein